jgi:hypothetical protein
MAEHAIWLVVGLACVPEWIGIGLLGGAAVISGALRWWP